MPALGLEEQAEVLAIEELFDWIADGGLVEAHNVWFEYCIWQNILVARHGWPAMPLEQWRCSAAKAAAHALPRALKDAGAALKLALTKDVEGSKVMKKMAKPRKSRKAERAAWAAAGTTPPQYVWWESVELLERLIAYCRVDVLAEEALSHVLDDLSPAETQMFLMDLRINARGFQLDRRAVQVALRLIHQEAVVLNQELTLLTDRVVRRATQRDQMLAWLMAMGLEMPNTQKGTIDDLLNGVPDMCGDVYDLSQHDPKVRRALEIMRALGRSSTAKYRAMKDWMARNGRVFGSLLYHGASTGRWSGKGVQPHNFPKPSFKKLDVNELWHILKKGDRNEIRDRYGDVMEALSNGLRGAITAAAGLTLYCADFSSIEARVLLWVADDQDGLDLFRRNKDLYLDMAEAIYGYPCTKEDNSSERAIGKIAILGLGYQMGASKFVTTCDVMGGITIDEDFAKQVVDAYREKYWRVKQLWADQEAAAIKAVTTGKRVFAGKVVWFTEGRFLYCQLPSGRRLAYPYPEAKLTEMRWGGQKVALSFMGVDSYTRKWKRLTVYGGLIVENIVQAISRDLMAHGMLMAEAHPDYQIVLSIHDELLAESPKGAGTVHEFETLMSTVPAWGRGCPVGAEGWSAFRYRKG
jgi:DNA polymerase